MQWIKFEVATPDKPEIMELSLLLGISEDEVIGKLMRVWCWADTHMESGHAPSVTGALLDKKVGHAGFCDALQKVGWVNMTPDSFEIVNWDYHNGKSAKSRALAQKRKQVSRNKGDSGHAESVTETRQERDQRREEKRREEIYKGSTRFTPPTPEQVAAYAKEKGAILDGEKFCDFYASKGWMVGKTKMKDWQAAVRNWLKSDNNQGAQSKPSEPALLPWQKPFVVT